jgi:hypothetical protein
MLQLYGLKKKPYAIVEGSFIFLFRWKTLRKNATQKCNAKMVRSFEKERNTEVTGNSKECNIEEERKSYITKRHFEARTMKQNGFKFKCTTTYRSECTSRCKC